MSACRYEIDVVAASRDGSWTDVLRDHAAGCISCAETAMVVAALADDVDALMVESSPLPDPKAIWIRSRMEIRQKRSSQAIRVITWTQRASIVVAVATGLFFAPGLRGLASRFWSGLPGLNLSDLPLLVSGPAAVMGLTFVVMGLMAVWSERSEFDSLR